MILKRQGKFKKAADKQECKAEYKKNKQRKQKVSKEKKGKCFFGTKDLIQNNISSVASFTDKLFC